MHPAIHEIKPNAPFLPERIFAWGTEAAIKLLDRLPEQGLAIVGTRRPQGRTLHQVQETVAWLAGSNLVILSGMARGIDSAAHQAALAARIPTVAILGTSIDVAYPPENATLRDQILEANGLVLSEYPPGTQTYPSHFIQRNRLLTAWSSAVWVVEAGVRSGALNTANWARQMNRPVFATPCFPGDPALAGNENLLAEQEAIPFYRPFHLGSVWGELSARHDPRTKNRRGKAARTTLSHDEQELARQVAQLSLAQGGARVDLLLDWACAQGWLPQRFFDTLRASLDSGLLLDRNGHLLKNSAMSV